MKNDKNLNNPLTCVPVYDPTSFKGRQMFRGWSNLQS